MFAFLCLWWLRVFSNPVLNNLLFSKSVTQSISNVCPLWWNTLSFNLCFPAVLPQRHERETSSQVWGVISAARCHDTEPHIHSRVTLMMTLWSWCTQRMKGFFYLQCADVFRLYFHTYLIKARWMHRQSHSCHKHITYVFHILSFCSLLLTARTDVPQESSGEESSGKYYYFVCVWTALNEKKSLYYNKKMFNFCISKLLMSSKLNTKYNS